MSDIVRLKTQTQIDNEAAAWTWRLDSGGLTGAARGPLEAWLREDPRHRAAFEELSRTWSALDQLTERAQDATITACAPDARGPWRRPLRLTRAPLRWAAAAAVTAIALGAAMWLTGPPGMQVLSTAVGQERHVTLADGSQLTLNTNTLLAVKLGARRRDIYLRQGEAHFEVVHDPARPFYVHAGDALIRDVGTQFEVRVRSARDVDVLVNEGRVEVQGPPAPAETAGGHDSPHGVSTGWMRAVSAGEQLVVAGPRLSVLPVSPVRIADELAWREGALVFQGEPLSRAIAEVGRYTRSRIVLTGPDVAALRISGRFRTDDVGGFLQALQAALPVRVSRPQPGLVYIAAR